MNEESLTFETPDLGFAAFLKMNDLELKEIGMDKRRFKFIFNDPESKVKQLKIDFVNSESYKFDSNIRILKLMIKSTEQKVRETTTA